MTFSKKLNVTPEAHEAVRLGAADVGESQSAWASERLCAAWAAVIAPAVDLETTPPNPTHENCVPRADFDACIDRWKNLIGCCVAAAGIKEDIHPADAALAIREAFAARPAGIVQPAPPREPQGCRCDGPEEAGPWHKAGCARRTE